MHEMRKMIDILITDWLLQNRITLSLMFAVTNVRHHICVGMLCYHLFKVYADRFYF